jgi:hypothetical protein
MEAVIAERLQEFVRGRGSPVVLIFGLLDTFYDEQAPLRDVRFGVRRMMQALQGLKRDGVSVMLASTDVGPVPPARRGLLPEVMGGMDRVFDMRNAVKKEGVRVTNDERRTGGTYERLAAAS